MDYTTESGGGVLCYVGVGGLCSDMFFVISCVQLRGEDVGLWYSNTNLDLAVQWPCKSTPVPAWPSLSRNSAWQNANIRYVRADNRPHEDMCVLITDLMKICAC